MLPLFNRPCRDIDRLQQFIRDCPGFLLCSAEGIDGIDKRAIEGELDGLIALGGEIHGDAHTERVKAIFPCGFDPALGALDGFNVPPWACKWAAT